MTTLNEAREAIYQAFVDAGVIASSQLTFDNEEFDPPVDASWIRLSVRHTSMSQSTLGAPGNRKFERNGVTFVQIFTPINKGSSPADTLATTAKNVFEGVRLTGTTIRFNDVLVREVGPEGKWYAVAIEANFQYDETR